MSSQEKNKQGILANLSSRSFLGAMLVSWVRAVPIIGQVGSYLYWRFHKRYTLYELKLKVIKALDKNSEEWKIQCYLIADDVFHLVLGILVLRHIAATKKECRAITQKIVIRIGERNIKIQNTSVKYGKCFTTMDFLLGGVDRYFRLAA